MSDPSFGIVRGRCFGVKTDPRPWGLREVGRQLERGHPGDRERQGREVLGVAKEVFGVQFFVGMERSVCRGGPTGTADEA